MDCTEVVVKPMKFDAVKSFCIKVKKAKSRENVKLASKQQPL
jgi:hypothetical protein